MPQSLAAIYLHLVFSTKERRQWLRDKDLRLALHESIGGISKHLECAPILIGGIEDHVHIPARFGRTLSIADWVKEIKRSSNLWLQQIPKVAAVRQPWAGGSCPVGAKTFQRTTQNPNGIPSSSPELPSLRGHLGSTRRKTAD